jgi:hypothetical protein
VEGKRQREEQRRKSAAVKLQSTGRRFTATRLANRRREEQEKLQAQQALEGEEAETERANEESQSFENSSNNGSEQGSERDREQQAFDETGAVDDFADSIIGAVMGSHQNPAAHLQAELAMQVYGDGSDMQGHFEQRNHAATAIQSRVRGRQERAYVARVTGFSQTARTPISSAGLGSSLRRTSIDWPEWMRQSAEGTDGEQVVLGFELQQASELSQPGALSGQSLLQPAHSSFSAANNSFSFVSGWVTKLMHFMADTNHAKMHSQVQEAAQKLQQQVRSALQGMSPLDPEDAILALAHSEGSTKKALEKLLTSTDTDGLAHSSEGEARLIPSRLLLQIKELRSDKTIQGHLRMFMKDIERATKESFEEEQRMEQQQATFASEMSERKRKLQERKKKLEEDWESRERKDNEQTKKALKAAMDSHVDDDSMAKYSKQVDKTSGKTSGKRRPRKDGNEEQGSRLHKQTAASKARAKELEDIKKEKEGKEKKKGTKKRRKRSTAPTETQDKAAEEEASPPEDAYDASMLLQTGQEEEEEQEMDAFEGLAAEFAAEMGMEGAMLMMEGVEPMVADEDRFGAFDAAFEGVSAYGADGADGADAFEDLAAEVAAEFGLEKGYEEQRHEEQGMQVEGGEEAGMLEGQEQGQEGQEEEEDNLLDMNLTLADVQWVDHSLPQLPSSLMKDNGMGKPGEEVELPRKTVEERAAERGEWGGHHALDDDEEEREWVEHELCKQEEANENMYEREEQIILEMLNSEQDDERMAQGRRMREMGLGVVSQNVREEIKGMREARLGMEMGREGMDQAMAGEWEMDEAEALQEMEKGMEEGQPSYEEMMEMNRQLKRMLIEQGSEQHGMEHGIGQYGSEVGFDGEQEHSQYSGPEVDGEDGVSPTLSKLEQAKAKREARKSNARGPSKDLSPGSMPIAQLLPHQLALLTAAGMQPQGAHTAPVASALEEDEEDALDAIGRLDFDGEEEDQFVPRQVGNGFWGDDYDGGASSNRSGRSDDVSSQSSYKKKQGVSSKSISKFQQQRLQQQKSLYQSSQPQLKVPLTGHSPKKAKKSKKVRRDPEAPKKQPLKSVAKPAAKKQVLKALKQPNVIPSVRHDADAKGFDHVLGAKAPMKQYGVVPTRNRVKKMATTLPAVSKRAAAELLARGVVRRAAS